MKKCPATPMAFEPDDVEGAQYSRETMLRSMLKSLPHTFRGPGHTLLWVAVRHTLGYGGGTSIKICQHFGYDPHSTLKEHRLAI